jgi:large subunit ribosomal protein L9
MEVILREHVENLGRRGEVVKVADGYARNYLLPRKLAMPANPGNKKIVERQGKIAEAKELAERSAAEAYAVRLTHADIVIARRVGENGALYGSVTAADIADDLKAKGFEVDKRKIHLDEPLKQLGEFTVPIKLHRDVVAQLRVKVAALDAPTE